MSNPRDARLRPALALLLLVAAAVLVAEEYQGRTFTIQVDGKDYQVQSGADVEVPCLHAEGKTHKLRAAMNPLQEFVRDGVRFQYPVQCAVTVDGEGQTLAVRVRHPAGPILKLTALAQKVDLAEALARHAETLRQHLAAARADSVQVTEVLSSLAGAPTPGRQISCVLLGDPRLTEIYYVAQNDRIWTVSLDYSTEHHEAARDLYDAVARSLKLP